ncbi:T9SS type A sorting domain-containing protein [bacterium]|nr:T9SS type A sorting domain-containing protein [bacterium]
MKNFIFIFLFGLVHTFSIGQNTFKIHGGNVIQANGNLVLKNTKLDNQANFISNGGTLNIVEDSGSDQNLGGTGATAIQNLALNLNSKKLLLSGDISVDANVSFTKGNLDLNGNDLTLGSPNGQILGENENNSFIGSGGGEIVKTVILNAPNSENPGNLGVTITSSSNLGSTTIRRGHVAQTVNGASSIKRYFDISPTNNSGLNATVRFNYLDAELNGIVENDLTPFRFENPNWANFQVSSNDNTANYVETMNVNAFSKWTLAASSAIFPIELLYFKAKALDNETVLLTWQTVIERNNAYFTVEKSDNGIDFESIEEVSGAGDSNTPISYQTFDKKPVEGINYYRLKQTDFDGAFSYSEIRSAFFKNKGSIISIFPNPTSEFLNIQIENPFEKGMLQLFDGLGKLIISTELKDSHSLNIAHLPKGVYLLKIKAHGKDYSEKVMIQ